MPVHRTVCCVEVSLVRWLLLKANHGFKRAILLALVAGCGNAADVTGHHVDSVVRFVVTNQLDAPITIAIDDTAVLILSKGASGGLTVSSAAEWLSWTSAKPTDSTGAQIPDGIGKVRRRVAGIPPVLEITNVINDTTYVTVNLFNATMSRVSIGVYDGSTVACASVLRAASGNTAGFTKTGYYPLLSGTEIRAYHDETHCTGPYVAWPASQLAQFVPKSGVVSLVLTAEP
jgi:hypothetical protein